MTSPAENNRKKAKGRTSVYGVAPLAAAALALIAVSRLADAGWGMSALSFNKAGAQAQQSATLQTASGQPRRENDQAVRSSELAAGRSSLVDRLSAREEALSAQERSLETREQLLVAAEQKIADELRTLRKEIQMLEALRAEQAASEKEDLSVLSRAYERMRPRDAARIFEVLDDDVLIPVAAGMRTQALAATLAQMSPQRAEALTIALAAYNSRFRDASDDAP